MADAEPLEMRRRTKDRKECAAAPCLFAKRAYTRRSLMKYDVTVSIVNYNDYTRTREAIRSLLDYTENIKYKIYVIDNASSDGSAERIASEFPMISVIFCDRNLGYGAANNLVIPKIDSNYHLVMNPDIVFRDNAIGELFEFMQENPDVGICCPAMYYLDGRPQPLPKRNPKFVYLVANRLPGYRLEKYRREYRMLDCDLGGPTDVEFVTGSFMFMRTDLFKEAGGFDERYFMYFEDADLTREIAKRARAVYVPDVGVLHGYKRISAKRPRYFLIHVSSMFKYFFKWRKSPLLQAQSAGGA